MSERRHSISGKKKNIFILLQVSNILQRIQSLRVALA
jgi:hypothetical protein